MRALCVDDEEILLQVLKMSVEASPDISEAVCFDDAIEALDWAKDNHIDIAFLDIRIQQMDGLELAAELKKVYPNLPVVFCTGYDNFAREAFKVHAIGYITKPITKAAVQDQIDTIKGIAGATLEEEAPKLLVQCFGTFEVYAEGKPLNFRRKKSKELLAYLVDRKGALVSMDQLVAVLWEDSMDDKNVKNYCHQVIYHLKTVLKEAGYENVLINRPEGYAVSKELIDCDYYKFLDGDAVARGQFCGEYMFQYSWAESTCGYLIMQ